MRCMGFLPAARYRSQATSALARSVSCGVAIIYIPRLRGRNQRFRAAGCKPALPAFPVSRPGHSNKFDGARAWRRLAVAAGNSTLALIPRSFSYPYCPWVSSPWPGIVCKRPPCPRPQRRLLRGCLIFWVRSRRRGKTGMSQPSARCGFGLPFLQSGTEWMKIKFQFPQAAVLPVYLILT